MLSIHQSVDRGDKALFPQKRVEANPSRKMEYMENIKISIHRLKNFLCVTESSTNRLRNADVKTLNKRWFFMKDVIIATGRDRLGREIELYKKSENSTERTFEKTYNNIYKRFSEADVYYKVMFDLLDGSNGYSEKNKNITLDNGDTLVEHIKDIINKLERIKIELQKK